MNSSVSMLSDPRDAFTNRTGSDFVPSLQRFIDPAYALAARTGTRRMMALGQTKTIIGTTGIGAVDDVNWQIAGTGDFDGDGKVDILWRFNGSGVIMSSGTWTASLCSGASACRRSAM